MSEAISGNDGPAYRSAHAGYNLCAYGKFVIATSDATKL